jgi:hypothetical protein
MVASVVIGECKFQTPIAGSEDSPGLELRRDPAAGALARRMSRARVPCGGDVGSVEQGWAWPERARARPGTRDALGVARAGALALDCALTQWLVACGASQLLAFVVSQFPLGHSDVSTAMIYAHVLKIVGARSPLGTLQPS